MEESIGWIDYLFTMLSLVMTLLFFGALIWFLYGIDKKLNMLVGAARHFVEKNEKGT